MINFLKYIISKINLKSDDENLNKLNKIVYSIIIIIAIIFIGFIAFILLSKLPEIFESIKYNWDNSATILKNSK